MNQMIIHNKYKNIKSKSAMKQKNMMFIHKLRDSAKITKQKLLKSK
jgi:hypothetical protein